MISVVALIFAVLTWTRSDHTDSPVWGVLAVVFGVWATVRYGRRVLAARRSAGRP